MSRKHLFGVLTALAFALMLATSALAAPIATTHPASPPHRPPHLIGKITAIDDHSLTVESLQGRTATIQTDEHSRFRLANGDAATFDDLKIGQWVTGRFFPTGERGVFLARVVIILPDDFDPARWKDTAHYAGKITAVNADSLTLQTRDGQTLTFQITAQTRFRSRNGTVQNPDDIQPGTRARVIARQGESGSVALLVGVGAPRRGLPPGISRFAGEITAASDDTLTLQTRDGQTLTFQITAQTCFRSRDFTAQSLADIRPGMHAMVIAREEENGLVALVVRVGTLKQP